MILGLEYFVILGVLIIEPYPPVDHGFQEEQKMPGLGTQVAIAVLIAVLGMSGVTAISLGLFPGTGSSQSSTSVTSSNSVQSSTIALPCNSPGVQCGGLSLLSANLTWISSISAWELDLSVNVTGNTPISTMEVFLDNLPVGERFFAVPGPYFPVGKNSISSQYGGGGVPINPMDVTNSTINFAIGQTYEIQVEGFYASCIQVQGITYCSHDYANVFTAPLYVKAQ